MAKKRMFSLEVVDTDLFLEMPQSTQNLYFHLGMRADDDGFVSTPKKIIRTIGANEDDLKILFSKKFVIPFDSGIIVIRHWKLNNSLRKDRYTSTIYKKEMKQLVQDENGVYNLVSEIGLPSGLPGVNQNATNGLPSIDKIRLDKISEDKSSKEESDSCVDGSNFNIANDSCVDGLQKITDFYNNNIGLLTPYGQELFKDYLLTMDFDVILYAMKLATEANVRNLKYIKAILNDWENKGIKTLIEAQLENQKFKNKNIEVEETEEEKKARKVKEIQEAMEKDATR